MDHSEVKHLPKVDHTPAELDAASRLLLRTAEVIERQGWCQCYIGIANGQVCLEGALMIAAGKTPESVIIPNTVAGEAVSRVRASVGMGAYQWNDKPGRTKEEVIAKLRAVALGG
jgi:hypothetical protein